MWVTLLASKTCVGAAIERERRWTRSALRSRNASASAAITAVVLVALLLLSTIAWSDLSSRINAVAYAIAAVGLGVSFGFAGVPSFGQAGFVAIGGYTTAIVVNRLGADPAVGIAAGVGAGTVASLLVAGIGMHRQGVYFAMITLAFGQLVDFVIGQWQGVTGGADGLPIASTKLFGVTVGYGEGQFWILGGCLVFVAAVAAYVRRTPLGYGMRAVRYNETRAAALGYSPRLHRTWAFCFAGAAGALAGGLLVWHLSFAAPSLASFTLSGNLFVMVLIGGQGTVIGPVIGAGLLTYLDSSLANHVGAADFISGVIFVAIVFIAPKGLAGLLRRDNWVNARWSRRSLCVGEFRGASADADAPYRGRC